jgi:hypothetical protein
LDQRLQVAEYEVSQTQDHQPSRYPAGTPPYGVSQEQTEHQGGEQASQGRGRLLPSHYFVGDEHRESLTPQHQVRCCPRHDEGRQRPGDEHATVAAQGTWHAWRLHCHTLPGVAFRSHRTSSAIFFCTLQEGRPECSLPSVAYAG